MIVSELIEKLQQFQPDVTVLGRGYESGWNDFQGLSLETLVKCNMPWYDGTYQEADGYYKDRAIEEPKEYICLV